MLDDYTDEELGRMVRQAARGRRLALHEKKRSKSGFVAFLKSIGLVWLAQKILVAVDAVWKAILAFI